MEAIGPVLVLLSLPLMFRWVPPNRFFGLRIPSTLRNRSVWYDANALSARHLFSLGLFLVLLEFVLPRSIRIEALRVIASIGFASIIIFDWRTANRWERERRDAGASGAPSGIQPHRGPSLPHSPRATSLRARDDQPAAGRHPSRRV
jgi:hypothetical protein